MLLPGHSVDDQFRGGARGRPTGPQLAHNCNHLRWTGKRERVACEGSDLRCWRHFLFTLLTDGITAQPPTLFLPLIIPGILTPLPRTPPFLIGYSQQVALRCDSNDSSRMPLAYSVQICRKCYSLMSCPLFLSTVTYPWLVPEH